MDAYVDSMYAFVLADVALQLQIEITHHVISDYAPDASASADMIHYGYGDARWSKRGFMTPNRSIVSGRRRRRRMNHRCLGRSRGSSGRPGFTMRSTDESAAISTGGLQSRRGSRGRAPIGGSYRVDRTPTDCLNHQCGEVSPNHEGGNLPR